MKSSFFKTNINCSGCIAKVANTLNSIVGVGNWQVDTASPVKLLTVINCDLPSTDITIAVKSAGFNIEELLTA